MRRISIYFLIIFCTIIKAQDDLVLVKLKNGQNVKGTIVQGGGPSDYYVRIKKRNQKTVDIYMKDIKHIYRGTGSLTIQISNEKGDPVDAVIIVQDLDSRNAESVELQETSYDDVPIGKYRITVEKKGYNSESKRMKVLLGREYYLAFELTPGLDPPRALKKKRKKASAELADDEGGSKLLLYGLIGLVVAGGGAALVLSGGGGASSAIGEPPELPTAP